MGWRDLLFDWLRAGLQHDYRLVAFRVAAIFPSRLRCQPVFLSQHHNCDASFQLGYRAEPSVHGSQAKGARPIFPCVLILSKMPAIAQGRLGGIACGHANPLPARLCAVVYNQGDWAEHTVCWSDKHDHCHAGDRYRFDCSWKLCGDNLGPYRSRRFKSGHTDR